MEKKNVIEEGGVSVKDINAAMNEGANSDEIVFVCERTQFPGKDGKKYWTYHVNGEVRGKNVRVDFEAKDKGGYEVLDIIFDIKPTAELVVKEDVMINEKTGEAIPFMVYIVRNFDENGDEYSYNLKPSQPSDKSLLQMLIKQNKRVNS